MTEGFGVTGFLKENYILLVVLGGVLIVWMDNGEKKREERAAAFVAGGLLAIAVMQYAERWLGNFDEPVIGRSILSAVVYAGYPFLIVIMLWHMEAFPHRFWMVAPAVVNAFCCAADIFGADLVFEFNEQNVFRRGPLGGLPFLVAEFYLVVLIIPAIRQYRGENRSLRSIFLYIAVSTSISSLLESANVVSAVNVVGMLDILLYMNHLYISGRFETENKLLVSENVRLINEKALADSKVVLLQHQIHRHFIYNSMVALKSLCRRSPEKAEIFVQDLSDYLRVNLESMTMERLVEFSKEREHIRQYLAIEQADPTSRFQVEWKIETEDFILPALSVEPLVENAVQHGVADSDLDGYIRISTHEEMDSFVVEVEDNGFGYSEEGAEQRLGGPGSEASAVKKQGGIGIENTRLRLDAIGGKLSISSDGYGTIARVEIPKGFMQGERGSKDQSAHVD